MARITQDIIWKKYRDWLLDEVRFGRIGMYSELINYLMNKSFEYSLPGDENRYKDGMDLRDRFFYYTNIPDGEFSSKCTVLEVLVALAIRIEKEYIGPTNDCFIFWEMISNLELDGYYNKYFNIEDVSRKVNRWLYREFDADGVGSIFPLKHPNKDQRTIQIWYQMNNYLIENDL